MPNQMFFGSVFGRVPTLKHYKSRNCTFFGAVVQTFPNRRNTSLNRCQIPGPSGLDNFGKESKKYRAAKRQKANMQKHLLN